MRNFFKKIYRAVIVRINSLNSKIHLIKTFIAEWVEIFRKKNMYKEIIISKKEESVINDIWERNYGKRISLKWHKLYQSINGEHNSFYFPEHIYSINLEPKLNPIEIAKFYSDKGLTELLYSRVENILFPKTLILNANGYYYNESREIITSEGAEEILLSVDEFVIKPTVGGSSGTGVEVISLRNLNKQDMKKRIKDVLTKYKNNYIVQEKLIPHTQYAKLYPNSINTIRLITYIVDDEIYHAPLSLRMGCGNSNVDNIHSGGIVIGVNDDGRLKKYGYQLGYSDSKKKFTHHPDTELKFENYKVPGTKLMIELAQKLHAHTPHLGIISWDLMVNKSEEVVLIEGNYYGQSVWFPQIVHGEPIFGKHTEKMIQLSK